jgi:hypothetical protein
VDRRTRNLFAVALIVVIALTGGAALLLSGAGPLAPGPPADAPTADGVVVAVDARSLTDVRSFALRTDDGRVLLFGLAELSNGTQFPPGHLAEHQATSTPIRVWYRDDGRNLEALYLEDAPVPSPSS